MDVDYEIYAEGEAELGWLNAQVSVQSQKPFDLDGFLMALLVQVNNLLEKESAEVAHLKVIGMANGKYSVANLVSSSSPPKLSIGANYQASQADVVINARVAVDPETLTDAIKATLTSVCDALGVEFTINTLQSFRPGKPVPTHRLEESR